MTPPAKEFDSRGNPVHRLPELTEKAVTDALEGYKDANKLEAVHLQQLQLTREAVELAKQELADAEVDYAAAALRVRRIYQLKPTAAINMETGAITR